MKHLNIRPETLKQLQEVVEKNIGTDKYSELPK
jgi:hypothetical protein